MISANIFVIDDIVSDIALAVEEGIKNSESQEVKIALGNFTGIKMLSGSGPNIKLKIASTGKVNTEIKSEFISKGINQTIHRVYLQIDCIVSILTPFEIMEENVSNQVILMENVIIGQIPSTYYNLNGFENDQDLLDVIE